MILVVAEHIRGQLEDVTFEMLGKGREIADTLGVELEALILGEGVKPLADSLGVANKVTCIEDTRLKNFNPEAYRKVIKAIIEQKNPNLVMIASSSQGIDLASPLSVEMGRQLVLNCTDVQIENGSLIGKSQICGGKLFAKVSLKKGSIITCSVGAFPTDKGKTDKPAQVQTVTPPVPLEDLNVNFRTFIEPEVADIDITKEPILISVGRGIQKQENIPVAEELAKTIGGVITCSRPVADQGWLPRTRLVGKSGKRVKPKLYLALGISGAPEHVEGMKDAELIIAVNTDESAPIFRIAHYGVSIDLFELIPRLTEELKNR